MGIQLFSHDVQSLVISPIEKMVDLVKKISDNPLGVNYKLLSAKELADGMETALLLQTVNKMGTLMRISFGDAGAAIIASNLSAGESKLNLLGGGQQIVSIFGFCDVRQFTDTTECLQEEVMLFVNRIAHILHGIVVQCSGAANKNIGDAFLLTWKLNDELTDDETSVIADKALLCFCKTIVELNRGQEFICNFSASASIRLMKRFPDYKVRIGSGLHVGWAVEGAIGSDTKIDASYLSPHVNRTEFLESSTKEYGVSLLLSEPFYFLLSSTAKQYLRQVDCVRVSDQEEPFGMFTYDMDLTIDFWSLPLMRPQATSSSGALDARDVSVVNDDDIEMKHAYEGVPDTETGSHRPRSRTAIPEIHIAPYHSNIWDTDHELVALRRKVTEPFRTLWKEGIASYIQGDWVKARSIFQQTFDLSGEKDGPSKNLIDMIDEHRCACPNDWAGYRWIGRGPGYVNISSNTYNSAVATCSNCFPFINSSQQIGLSEHHHHSFVKI